MKNQIFSFLFIFLTVSVCFFTSVRINQAYADSISLKISPSVLQIHATPPAAIKAPFTIENLGSSPVHLTIIFKPFKQNSTTNTILQTVQVADNGIAQSSLSLGPQQQKKLDLSIILPKNIPPTDTYFSVIFLTSQQDTNNASSSLDEESSSIAERIGIALPVLLTSGESDPQSGFLDTFSSPIFLQAGPVPFTVRISNTGTHFISPRGVIFIKNMFGQTVGRVDLPETNVLAGTTRSLTSLEQPLSDHAVWSEKFLLGFYTATISIAMSSSGSLYTRSIHFIAFPTTFLLIFFVVIIIALSLILRIKKKLSD